MDLQVPAPSSSDGLFEPPAVPPAVPAPQDAAAPPPSPPAAADAQAPETPAAKPRKGLGGLWKRGAKGAAPAAEGEGDPAAAKPKKRRKKKRRFDAPAWSVSLVVHVVVLALLGAATFSTEVKQVVANINSALVSTKGAEEEALHVLATPSDSRSDEAAGSEASAAASGGGGFSGIGTGPPSATPKVAGVGSGVGEDKSLPGVKVNAKLSGLSMIPSAATLAVDLGGGGMVRGDVAFEAKDVGEALDQVAREILRHLAQHKLTVVWMFDESESMKDDQRAIKEKFDRITTELKVNTDTSKKQASPLTHAIVGFGKNIHYELEKPTFNIDAIGTAIDRLKVDDSGAENTMQAIQEVINHYQGLISKDRRLLIVLVTDESGDDGDRVEETHSAVLGRKVPVYVIGRQSLFGYQWAHLRYVDPVTKDVYWPTIRRGPETPDVEQLQYDGLHDRWDEQPSGFAPYELARISKDSGGIYFLLPSEENMRVRQREKLYSMKTLKEYIPEYDNRVTYWERRNKSEFRRTLFAIIQETRWKTAEDHGYVLRRHFPISPPELKLACQQEYPVVDQKLKGLLKIQDRLESLKKLRDREPLKRWQAHYDLMLAQVVCYQVKAYEYRACLQKMYDKPPKPKEMPRADLVVEWVIEHSTVRIADKEKTEKKYQEGIALLKKVIEMHPRTPWADLAQDEINRGLGCQNIEWHHNPKYDERAKLVPKY